MVAATPSSDGHKTAVLLLNLGGPDSLDSVEPFLVNLFSDRSIIKLSPFPFLQGFIARKIARARAPKTMPKYEAIGGSSPLLKLTVEQARALQDVLATRLGAVDVYVGMRYWHPFIADAVDEIYRHGVRRLVVMPLYPQYSIATTGSCFAEVKKAIRKTRGIAVNYVDHWYDHPGYLDAMAEKVTEAVTEAVSDHLPEDSGSEAAKPAGAAKSAKSAMAGTGDNGGAPRTVVDIVCSAHSLPADLVEKDGDPYVTHVEATVTGIKERVESAFSAISAATAALTTTGAQPPALRWHLGYQSRSGPVRWLAPTTDEVVHTLASDVCSRMVMVPLSFVSDHIETLHELDIEYRELATGLGIPVYVRAKALNSTPVFIEALADIVEANLPTVTEDPREDAIAAAISNVARASASRPKTLPARPMKEGAEE